MLGAITFAGVYTWLIGAMRAGRRDRVYPLPVFCIAFWFAHWCTILTSLILDGSVMRPRCRQVIALLA
ncbi:MAG: hypothetical protein ACRDRL_06095 [Sciscionella sp.]